MIRLPGRYDYFDHAADLGLRVNAPTLPGLFVVAAKALMLWIGPVPAGSEQRLEVLVEGTDLESLLVRWLQETLYVFQHRKAYVAGVRRLDLEIHSLRAVLRCIPWEESDSPCFQEIKAVTYHKLEVRQTAAGWSASVIVDI